MNELNRVCVCGYRGRSFFPSKLIKWITWSEYSHVAIMLPDTGAVFEAWDGVGVRCIDSLSDHHTPKTIVSVMYIDVTPEQYLGLIDALQSQLGKKYDWKGVLRFPPLLRPFISKKISKRESERWFCSELVNWAFWKIGLPLINKPPHATSPADVMVSPLLKFVNCFTCGVSNYDELLEEVRSK